VYGRIFGNVSAKNTVYTPYIWSFPWLDRPFLVKLCQLANFGSISPTTSPFWELKVVLDGFFFNLPEMKAGGKTQWVARNRISKTRQGSKSAIIAHTLHHSVPCRFNRA
jgi:hypothetical protein